MTTTRTAVKALQVGDRIVANIWGLDRTTPRAIVTLAAGTRGTVLITVAEHADVIALRSNVRVDVVR